MSERVEKPSEQANLVYHESQDRMALLPNYYAWIANHFVAHVSGVVLELGAGAGLVVRNYLDRVERVVAADINRELLARIERDLPRDKVRAVEVDLRGDWHELRDVQADCVIALDVVEHFQDDADFITKMKSRLRPGGKIIVKVPAQSKLYGGMDRASGHYRRYDDDDLRALMERHGFTTLALRHMNPAGAWSYRFKKEKRTNFSKTFSPTRLKAVNTLIPMIALLDHLPFLKGLSLVGVFELEQPAAG